jgi:hypothetical protein
MDENGLANELGVGVSDEHLARLERQAFRELNDTGFDEIATGLSFLFLASLGALYGLASLVSDQTADSVGPVVAALALLVFFGALLFVDWRRKREIGQRLGTVRPGNARRRRQRLGVVIPLSVFVPAGLFALWRVGWGESWDDGFNYLVFTVMVIVGGVVGLVEAHFTERPRQRALGWVVGVAWGAAFAGGFLAAPAIVAFALAGAVQLAVGFVVLRRFRRGNPVLPEHDDAGG